MSPFRDDTKIKRKVLRASEKALRMTRDSVRVEAPGFSRVNASMEMIRALATETTLKFTLPPLPPVRRISEGHGFIRALPACSLYAFPRPLSCLPPKPYNERFLTKA